MDEDLKALITVLIEGQIRTDHSLSELTVLVNHYVQGADQSREETGHAIQELAVVVGGFVEASEARVKRLEENLDGLIRAITSEHKNGKGHG